MPNYPDSNHHIEPNYLELDSYTYEIKKLEDWIKMIQNQFDEKISKTSNEHANESTLRQLVLNKFQLFDEIDRATFTYEELEPIIIEIVKQIEERNIQINPFNELNLEGACELAIVRKNNGERPGTDTIHSYVYTRDMAILIAKFTVLNHYKPAFSLKQNRLVQLEKRREDVESLLDKMNKKALKNVILVVGGIALTIFISLYSKDSDFKQLINKKFLRLGKSTNIEYVEPIIREI